MVGCPVVGSVREVTWACLSDVPLVLVVRGVVGNVALSGDRDTTTHTE